MDRRTDTTRRRRRSGADDGPYVARAHLVCAECRYARLYAVQPRALCTCHEAALEGSVVFSGRPACGHVRPRQGDDRTLTWCSLRATTTHLCFARVRPHLY